MYRSIYPAQLEVVAAKPAAIIAAANAKPAATIAAENEEGANAEKRANNEVVVGRL